MISPSRRFFIAPIVAFLSIVTAQSALGQSTNRKIGTQFTVTAEPTVPRPNEKPCVVKLFSGFSFAFFADTDQTFDFTPAAHCSGPWEKVVLEVNFSENGGVQFDRTASLYLANANLYFGTTPEPLQTATNTWHVERDVTDYSALFGSAQTGTMVLQNCTTDCPPPFNTELNGVFTVSADLEFYPARGWRNHSQATETADVILPLEQPNGSGGISLPALLSSPTDQLTTALTFPTNVERVYLDVVSQSQSNDEQWYACFPNDLSSINDLFGCGNTDFRETEVSIDGQAAGIAPVSPWVFTGFLPDQWVPIPAAQTLEFVPYRVNLTPFAALLSDGKQHTVALSVFDDDNFFSVTGSLLLFLDKGSKQVTGELTKNTLTSPSPVENDNLQGTTTVTGTIGVTQDRDFTIAGYVHTSHGKVETSITQKQDFSSTSTIDFNTVTGDPLDQNTSVHNSVSTTTTVSSWLGQLVTQENFSFPITVDVTLPVSSATFGLTVATSQKYHADKQIFIGPFPVYFNSVTNTVQSTDVSPANSSQQYSYFDSNGVFYDCQIASKNNTLTSVSRGCSAQQQVK
jgi:peptide N-acetyl-beta-D-glucosaminyl asparaginase amidase A